MYTAPLRPPIPARSFPVEASEMCHCYPSVLHLFPEHGFLSVCKKVDGSTWLLNPGAIRGFELQHNRRIPGAKRSKQNAGQTLSQSLACLSSYIRDTQAELARFSSSVSETWIFLYPCLCREVSVLWKG